MGTSGPIRNGVPQPEARATGESVLGAGLATPPPVAGAPGGGPDPMLLRSVANRGSGGFGWLLRLSVSGAILIWLIGHTAWGPILAVMSQVRLEFCLLALALYCATQIVSSCRWRLLARSLGFQEPLRRFVALFYVGMFFNLFLPTSVGGDVVKAWQLGGRPGRRWLAALTVLSDRLSGLMALLVIACTATFVEGGAVPEWADYLVWGMTGAGALGFLALPVLGRWSAKLRSLAAGMSLYRGHRARWAGAFLLGLVVQSASIGQVWLLGQALGLTAPLLTYAVAVPLVSLFTMLPISFNGMGVREGGLVLLLTTAGVTQAAALSLGLLWFLMLAAASCIGGGVYVLGRFGRQQWGEANGLVSHHPDQGRAGQPSAAA